MSQQWKRGAVGAAVAVILIAAGAPGAHAQNSSAPPGTDAGVPCVKQLDSATHIAARQFRATLRAELKPALAQVRSLTRGFVDETASASDVHELFDALVEFHTATRIAWHAAADAGVVAAFSTLGSCGAGPTPPDFLYGGGGALDDLLLSLEADYERALARLRRDVGRAVSLSAQSSSVRFTARLASPMVRGEVEHAYKAGSSLVSVGPFPPVIDVALGLTEFGAGSGAERTLLVSGSSHDDEIVLAFGPVLHTIQPVQDRFTSEIPVDGGPPERGSALLYAFTGEPNFLFTDIVGIGLH